MSASIVGDWTLEDVEKFFASGTDRANLCAQEIDQLIDNFFVMDGDSTYSYKLPRYYRERLLCVKKSFNNVSLKKKMETLSHNSPCVNRSYNPHMGQSTNYQDVRPTRLRIFLNRLRMKPLFVKMSAMWQKIFIRCVCVSHIYARSSSLSRGV